MTAEYDSSADSSETGRLFTSLPPVNALAAGVAPPPQKFHPDGLYHRAGPALGRFIKRVKIAPRAATKASTAMISAIIARVVPPPSPVSPGGPTEPSWPAEPAEPAVPWDPSGPAGPAGPASPGGPDSPSGPCGPAGPSGPWMATGTGVAMGVIVELLAVRFSTSASPCCQVTVWSAARFPILKVIVVPEPCNTSKGP